MVSSFASIVRQQIGRSVAYFACQLQGSFHSIEVLHSKYNGVRATLARHLKIASLKG